MRTIPWWFIALVLGLGSGLTMNYYFSSERSAASAEDQTEEVKAEKLDTAVMAQISYMQDPDTHVCFAAQAWRNDVGRLQLKQLAAVPCDPLVLKAIAARRHSKNWRQAINQPKEE